MTVPTTPEGAATPTAEPPQPGQAWSLGAEAPQKEEIAASEGIKEAVASKSETAAGVVDTLDAMALSVGDMRVSLWDALIVFAIFLLVIGFAWLVTRASRSALRRMTKLDSTQQLLAEKLLTIAIWGAAFFVGIDLLGIDLTALAVFSGAFGLAIGFGLQKTFGNLIAGIILLMDKSIKPGDVIAVTDMSGNETFGQIRKIGIRAVSVTTRDQREYLIPNENLMVNQVENWSYSSKNVRMQIPVGVSYSCDIEVAEDLMLEAAKMSNRVLKSPPPTAWLHEYGDSSVNFILQVWINDPEEGVGNIRSAVLKNLWRLFAENDIEIPFPQRDINLRNNKQFERLIEALAAREEARSKK
ncbi:mechanosensitive ion channel [Altererythrobacter arenosus]|uniref:Mechanosensitive ion channel n=1 Tax=Altererythrobacter arenosus TaxID=3032592 RepID=A0ABY8FSH8_9SPHN|nr:mechanosensitive ion channel domain-containing protein [Altererythrobacter sp. CAU 1644]WFL77967.1 mechanosensitive ion channel [Altererythrobacter sp. CAU 1644]